MKQTHVDPLFWKGKKVFLTGHTGFKGGWLSLWLASMGAKVTGYALAPNTIPNLFDVLAIDSLIEKSHIADIRELPTLQKAMSEAKPDVVIHMAAQPLVRYSYANPVETYATNVMGTVHVLESTRTIDSVCATVVVTTDKCYENKEWVWGYRENDPMGGFDVYRTSHTKDTDIGWEYDETRTGGDLRLGKEITETVRADLTYRLEDRLRTGLYRSIGKSMLSTYQERRTSRAIRSARLAYQKAYQDLVAKSVDKQQFFYDEFVDRLLAIPHVVPWLQSKSSVVQESFFKL